MTLTLTKPWRLQLTRAQQEFLKWLAVFSMLLDHIDKLVLGGNLPSFSRFGRLAFPLFCFLIAYNITRRGVNPRHYFVSLTVFGLLSQPVYMWTFQTASLNIFFTLLLGVFYLWIVGQLRARAFHPAVAHIYAVALVLLPSTRVSYDVFGPFLIPVLASFLATPRLTRLPLVAFYLMLTNNLVAISVYTLLLIPAVFVATTFSLPLPRSSKWFFYSFYPLHLLALAGLKLWL